MIYYWETELRNGRIVAKNDREALRKLLTKSHLLCIYKESDTKDGRPYLIVWERKQ